MATGVALAAAALLLVAVILPAEYGIDWLGTGRLLGLVDLASARPGIVTRNAGEFRRDSREFVLGPFQTVEYKYRIEKGASMLYSWRADGLVRWDLHSEPDGARPGYAESFDAADGSEGNGTYTAPFSGIHGWYWENIDKKEVRVTIYTSGFYSGATEFFGGGTVSHEVRDLHGNLVKRPPQ